MPEMTTQTVTVTKGTPEWAFLVACRALALLKAAGAPTASVTLYPDGSGNLRIPHAEVGVLSAEVRAKIPRLVGSYRFDFQEAADLVLHQCQGFSHGML